MKKEGVVDESEHTATSTLKREGSTATSRLVREIAPFPSTYYADPRNSVEWLKTGAKDDLIGTMELSRSALRTTYKGIEKIVMQSMMFLTRTM